MKIFPKILTILFLAIFIFQLAGLIFLFALPQTGQAAATFKPQVDIPGMDKEFGTADLKTGGYAIPGSTASIAKYIRVIYKYAIGIVGILAAVVLMIGGVLWIVAGGNATAIGEAKSWIGASLTGLVIALCSYLILATVNPALVDFKTTTIKTVTPLFTTTFDASTSCGLIASGQGIVCGSQCPAGQKCDKVPAIVGAKKCPDTINNDLSNTENDNYYICRKIEGAGATNPDCCENNSDGQCLSGYVCNMKMTNYTSPSCLLNVSTKGVCSKLQEKDGDCMENSDCKSNKCNFNGFAWNKNKCE